MKKTLMTCLAVAVVLAVASSAFAITCTIDQRPAATLLVPYFQVSFDADGNLVTTGPGARDTIVTIANASSAPMIAHVDVFDRFSSIALDFDVALSAYDVQAMRMSDIITGFLPVTVGHISGSDVCQGNGGAVYPNSDGYLRVNPLSPTSGQDNTQATTEYGVPAYNLPVAEQLRTNCDGTLDFLAIGYVTVDHVNYCNLSNPSDIFYYENDAIGMENNLWGEIIFTSGEGLPTYALSTVNIEADSTIGDATLASLSDELDSRSFYARYYNPFDEFVAPFCPNCSQGQPCVNDPNQNWLDCNALWDVGFGDQREPLGLRWAARWFDAGIILTSNVRVWRASTSNNGTCDNVEPTVTLRFYDEDENTTNQGKCPSPCSNPTFNFPYETQQRNITDFSRPVGADAGWVQMDFLNGAGTDLDQAWVDYSFEGSIALESILVPGTQLDPSSCNPIGVDVTFPVPGQEVIAPAIPTVVGTGVNSGT